MINKLRYRGKDGRFYDSYEALKSTNGEWFLKMNRKKDYSRDFPINPEILPKNDEVHSLKKYITDVSGLDLKKPIKLSDLVGKVRSVRTMPEVDDLGIQHEKDDYGNLPQMVGFLDAKLTWQSRVVPLTTNKEGKGFYQEYKIGDRFP